MVGKSGQLLQVNRFRPFPDIFPCRKQGRLVKAARQPSFRLVKLLPVVREQFPEVLAEFFRLQIPVGFLVLKQVVQVIEMAYLG